MRRKSVIGKFMIDRLESATSCFDIRLDIFSVDVRSKVEDFTDKVLTILSFQVYI